MTHDQGVSDHQCHSDVLQKLERIENIVKAMEFLKMEAIKNGNTEVSVVIDSAFMLCRVSYQIAQKKFLLDATEPDT